MADNDFDEFWVHPFSVTPLTGQGATGVVYGSPQGLMGFVDRTVRLVRDKTGKEVVASTTIYTPISNKDLITTGSKITLGVRESTVIAVGVHELTGDWPESIEVFIE